MMVDGLGCFGLFGLGYGLGFWALVRGLGWMAWGWVLGRYAGISGYRLMDVFGVRFWFGFGLFGLGHGFGLLFGCCAVAWRDEPESLILAQSERWRHA